MNNPIEIEPSPRGKNLYIFFGGICAGILIPPFEFYNASKILDENKIFIRDFSQCWYQDGLPGISGDIHATAHHIQKLIEEIHPDKIYFVGNSMGGFAAILFSSLLGMGEVIAFAPQTFISPLLRIRHRDLRWTRQILNAYRRSLFKHRAWDLRALLLRVSDGRKISVFVSSSDRLDDIHATHIEDISGVRVHRFTDCGHDVVKRLRDEGKLPAIMSGTYA